MSQLVNSLILKGYVRSDAVISAFTEIQRVEFVPEEYHNTADAEVPFPVGFGQSIPQPQVVATMLELLSVDRGETVLEVGCGSGWITSLLAYIVGPEGHVYATDAFSELIDMTRENVDKYQFIKRGIVNLSCKEVRDGWQEYAPYTKILVNSSCDELPQSLVDQLEVGGIMVIPVFNDIWYIHKENETDIHKEVYSGFSFVPLETHG